MAFPQTELRGPMTKISVSIVGAGLLSIAGLVGAGGAVADPPTATMADVVVQHLQSEGYNIQFNMPSNMPLSSFVFGEFAAASPEGRVRSGYNRSSRAGVRAVVDRDCHAILPVRAQGLDGCDHLGRVGVNN